ncbi:hypothetical protein J6590_089907 [Homalodisca vitripennis]|nr:hypothetical protein J6590_089907 [Homalodisca vitripennis]
MGGRCSVTEQLTVNQDSLQFASLKTIVVKSTTEGFVVVSGRSDKDTSPPSSLSPTASLSEHELMNIHNNFRVETCIADYRVNRLHNLLCEESIILEHLICS